MQLCIDDCLKGVELERDQEYADSHNPFDIFDSCVAYALKLAKKFDERLFFLHATHDHAEASGYSMPHVSIDRICEEKESTERGLPLCRFIAQRLYQFRDGGGDRHCP
jgi:hypothetical protein